MYSLNYKVSLMKIKIVNLGPVKEAELALKPLTVFVGANNTGKTWTAYAISSLLAPFSLTRYISNVEIDKFSELFPPLYEVIQQVIKTGNAKLDILEFASSYGEKYFNHLAKYSKLWLGEMLGTQLVSFENFELFINLEDSKSDFLAQVNNFPYRNNFGAIRDRSDYLLNAFKAKEDKLLYIFTYSNAFEIIPEHIIKEYVIRFTFEIIHRSLCSNILIFPSERTSLIYDEIEAKKQAEMYQDLSTNFDVRPGIPGIFGSFGYLKKLAYQSNLIERKERAKKDSTINKYLELADLLESDILKGRVDFSPSQINQTRDLRYQTENGITLELPAVSSMVKELTPLVLFLRYVAEPDSWIVIDEPEVNLHPDAQARIMEFLVMLVNADLRVLITTHSPYMVDHLVNLMKAATHPNKEEIAKKFYLHRTEAFIPKEKVSVNLFGDGTAKNILDEAGFIDWATFSSVSDEVSRLYFEL